MIFKILLISLIGNFLGLLFSLIPALHIYNILALFLIIELKIQIVPLHFLPYFFAGTITGYVFGGTLQVIYFSTNDDSTIFYLLPGQKFLSQGRAHEGVLLSITGSFLASIILVIFSPFVPFILTPLREIFTPHIHWILGAIGTFILISEWPRTIERNKNHFNKLKEAWKRLSPGFFIFFLSGFLGYVVLKGNILNEKNSFQNLMPLFVGLFALPVIILNILSQPKIPKQNTEDTIFTTKKRIIKGLFSGVIGGSFAAFFPVVTGGIGAFLAGHATGQKGDDVFLLAQGVNRFIYYVGAFLLFFVPFAGVRRGGAAWMLDILYSPQNPKEYYLIIGTVLISASFSFFLSIYISKIISKNISKIPYKWLSFIVIIIILSLTYSVTGIEGLLILLLSASIGILPPLLGTRRLNLLGALIIPLTIQMSSFSQTISRILGF